MNFSRSDFPEGFVFGAATSSYQIEGHGFGDAGTTHWDTFAATPGNVARGENGKTACGHYWRFQEDLDLAANAGLDAWRFSTSWARVLPDGKGVVNQKGLDFYDRLVDEILRRGMEPHVTLYHWELPSPLADLGGWANRDIAHWFGDFAAIVTERIGDRIFSVAPINEPWCVAWLSHFLGFHPPGLRDIRATTRAMHHVLLAHGTAVQALRTMGVEDIGAVFNFEFAAPANEGAQALELANLYDGIYNRWFLGGIRKRQYPANVMDGLECHLPKNWDSDLAIIGTPIDWIGINYYTRKLLACDGTGLFPGYREVEGPLPKTDVGWEIFPEGLYHFLAMVDREYADGLPIYVTENGMACADRPMGNKVYDPERSDFIERHVGQVHRAILDGIDVRGYFVWSMLDNFEWSLGYDKRFGLVYVDFDSLMRMPKSSYWSLKESLDR